MSDRSPYKGYMHVDENDEAYWDGIVRETLGLIRRVRQHSQREGMLDRMLPGAADSSEDPASALAEALSEHAARYTRQVYACEACGRLLVESAPGSASYRSFVPEDDDRAVLQSEPEPPATA